MPCTHHIALEWREALDCRQWLRISHPLYGLCRGHQPDLWHVDDGVQESDETFFVVFMCEPSSMVVQSERSSETDGQISSGRS